MNCTSAALAACAGLAGCTLVTGLVAGEPDPATAATERKEPGMLDVRNAFRNVCGFCHEDYGRKAGKGPQLMGSPLSDEQLSARIRDGVPGRMPAFRGAFSDAEIGEIVRFIRALDAYAEP